jgi:hypothetical protein
VCRSSTPGDCALGVCICVCYLLVTRTIMLSNNQEMRYGYGGRSNMYMSDLNQEEGLMSIRT